MTGRIIKKWMSLLLAVTMLISMASLNVSASETDKTYKAYDASRYRKVISQNGTTDSEWSLCMTSTKKSPGTSTEATGEYSKNENATKDTYTRNSGKGDFQKIKRMLFYKLKHPELNYQVLQNEYYYQQGDEANKRQYDTNYSQYPQLNQEKQKLRTFAEDSSHDDEINSKMEVFIYKAKDPFMQNLISAKLKELPPPTPLEPAKTSLKVEKKWQGIDSKDAPEITVYLVKNGIKTDQSIKLNNGNNWKGEFKDLKVVDNIRDKKANIYTIVESGEKDGKVVLEGKEYKVTYAGGKVVNTKEVPPPSTPSTKVKFSKKALTENGEELKG
ncbi:Cna B-type domain-containing protein, partial [Streptococcus anginosus]|uniref:Cna B-type domain-containing protein n=1 Tax=Streptococcus anginosus TaxID=1328 RepID=UPI0018999D1E